MANLRIVNVTATDSTTITATFTENLNEDIGTANVTITSQTAGVPDSLALIVNIVGDELNITCQPLIPLAAYFVTFFSTSNQLFNSLNGDAVILNDGVTNRQLIIAPLDSNNPVQTYLTNFLQNNVYNLDPTSIVSSWIQVLSTALSRALYDIRQSGNENYLSFTVIDEAQTRGPGPFDRLNEEGAYEVLRVGLAPTNATTQYVTPIASFPSYPVSLWATPNVENLTTSSQDIAGTFNLDDFTINLSKQSVIILTGATFVYTSSLSAYVYDIQTYGYQILTSEYDPDFAFTYLQLNNNQIILSSKILNDPLFSTENIAYVQVSYQYKDTGKIIDPTSLIVDTVIPSGREVVPPIENIFALMHAPIVTNSDSIGVVGDVTFIDPNALPGFGTPHSAFLYEIPFNLGYLPSMPGQYSVDYNTGNVYVFGSTATMDGTGPYPPLATYFYRHVFKSEVDYVYASDTGDLVSLPLGSLVNSQANIYYNYEQVLSQGIDYKADVHIEVLSENIQNRLTALNSIQPLNFPVTDVFRIFNQTTGEIYGITRWSNNAIYFNYVKAPKIVDETGERATFQEVLNEVLFVSSTTASGGNVIFQLFLNNNHIIDLTQDAIGSSINTSVFFSDITVFAQEIYFASALSVEQNNLRLTNVGDYQVDYVNGVIYCLVVADQSLSVGNVSYRCGYIVTNNPNIITVNDIYYQFSSLTNKLKHFSYIRFTADTILPSSFDVSDESFLMGNLGQPYEILNGQVGAFVNANFTPGVTNNVKFVRGLYEYDDLLYNISPINFAPVSTANGMNISVASLQFQEYHTIQFDGTHFYVLANTNLLFSSPNITMNLTAIKLSNSLPFSTAIVFGTPFKVILTGNSPAVGNTISLTYSYTINNLSRVVVDYNKGDYWIDYSYLYDTIILSYEYGDNVLDFSQSTAISAGTNYYVSYKVGALRDALLANFGTLINIPLLNDLNVSLERERYRDSLMAAMQSFPEGPTISSISNIVNTIVHTPPKIVESAFTTWSLGNALLNPEPIATTGSFSLLPAKYDNGVLVNTPGQTIKFPIASALRLEQGSLQTWIAANWNGIDNQSNLSISILKNGLPLPSYDIFVGPGNYHPTLNNKNQFTINTNDKVSGIPNESRDGVFIYYAPDLSGLFDRWYIDVLDGYGINDGYSTKNYSITINTNGKFYDVVSKLNPQPTSDLIFSGTNSLTYTITGLSELKTGITFIADYNHYIFDFGKSENCNRFSLYKDESGYINFRVIDKNKQAYTVSADISSWSAGQLHQVAVSWALNTLYARDELHLFIDGLEVPNILKFKNKTDGYSAFVANTYDNFFPSPHEKFRTVDPEEIYGVITNSVVSSIDLVTTAGSPLVSSSINFSASGVTAPGIIYINEAGFSINGYTILNVNGQTLTLNANMPISTTNSVYSVNPTSFDVQTAIDLYPNIAVSLLHSNHNDNDLQATSGSPVVSSVSSNFISIGVVPGYVIWITNFDNSMLPSVYTVLSVSTNSLTLSDNMPASLSSNGVFYLYPNTPQEIPGVRAVFPAYSISRDHVYDNAVLTINNLAKPNDVVLINTLGMNNGIVDSQYYLWNGPFQTSGNNLLWQLIYAGNTIMSGSDGYITPNPGGSANFYSPSATFTSTDTTANGYTIAIVGNALDGYSTNYIAYTISAFVTNKNLTIQKPLVNTIKTKLLSPILLSDVAVTHVLIDYTNIGPSNSTYAGGVFTSSQIITDQPSLSDNGRTLSIYLSGTNVTYGTATVTINGTINGVPNTNKTFTFTENGIQNTTGYLFSYVNYIVVVCKPINATENCVVVKIEEQYPITIAQNSSTVPVIRYSYQILFGNTLTGAGGSTVTDANRYFSSEDVGNYLIIASPSSIAGQYQITGVLPDHGGAILSNSLSVFSNGVYEILDVSTYRTGLQNGLFTFELADGYVGSPYNLVQGLYKFEYYSHISIPMSVDKLYGYVGSDINGNNLFNGILDEFQIVSQKLTDTRIGETAAVNQETITKDFNSLVALSPTPITLVLLHFDTFPFINSANIYITADSNFIQSGMSVNDNFGQSVSITNTPIIVNNTGILSSKTQGSIEFWISPLYDTGNDPNYRYYFDATAMISQKVVSTNNATVKVSPGTILNVLNVKTQVGDQNIDYFAGGKIDPNGQTLYLNRALPNQNTPVVVNYIPNGTAGDRISIFKDPSGYINFQVMAAGRPYSIRAPSYWVKNTWHRIKVTYIFNTGLGSDQISLFMDGYERGNILLGSGLLFGQGVQLGSISVQPSFGQPFIGPNTVNSSIVFTDTVNELFIGSDFTGYNGAYALFDNLRISDISRPLFRPFGEPIDVNYSSNTSIVYPVTPDLYTTFLMDFNTLVTLNTSFATLKNPTTGLFDFSVTIFDQFDIVSSNPIVKQILEELLNTLKPAQSSVYIRYQ
jgi:hypothetical protein